MSLGSSVKGKIPLSAKAGHWQYRTMTIKQQYNENKRHKNDDA